MMTSATSLIAESSVLLPLGALVGSRIKQLASSSAKAEQYIKHRECC
jgi:hypothetical protein